MSAGRVIAAIVLLAAGWLVFSCHRAIPALEPPSPSSPGERGRSSLLRVFPPVRPVTYEPAREEGSMLGERTRVEDRADSMRGVGRELLGWVARLEGGAWEDGSRESFRVWIREHVAHDETRVEQLLEQLDLLGEIADPLVGEVSRELVGHPGESPAIEARLVEFLVDREARRTEEIVERVRWLTTLPESTGRSSLVAYLQAAPAAHFEDPAEASRLTELATSHRDPEVRAMAVRRLPEILREGGADALLLCLADESALVRRYAVRASSSFPDPRVSAHLCDTLGSAEGGWTDVHVAAIRALSSQPSTRTAPTLASILVDTDVPPLLRSEAARSLVRLGRLDPEARRELDSLRAVADREVAAIVNSAVESIR